MLKGSSVRCQSAMAMSQAASVVAGGGDAVRLRTSPLARVSVAGPVR